VRGARDGAPDKRGAVAERASRGTCVWRWFGQGTLRGGDRTRGRAAFEAACLVNAGARAD
jgi:hypothetical protein